MAKYAIGVKLLIKKMSMDNIKHVWYADDAGSFSSLHNASNGSN